MMRSLFIAHCFAAQVSGEVVSLPDPRSPMPEGKTAVWSPLFQATWDEMNREIGGKPKEVNPPNELMARLDGFEWKAAEVMPENGWKVWGGEATPDFLKRVNAEAKEMVGEEPFGLSGEIMPGTVACFGLLNREVEFEKGFFESKVAAMRWGAGREQVRFYGLLGEHAEGFRTVVRVLAYRPADGSHALEISCKGGAEKVILYRPAKPLDFATACRWISVWRNGQDKDTGHHGTFSDGWLHGGDEVRVPYVSLDVEADFAGALQSGRIYGKPGDPWAVRIAKQRTKLMLHDKGARVRVETKVEADPFGGDDNCFSADAPRRFIYDRPFFVFLWREKAEWPYLGVWVGDDSALRKF